MKIRFLLPLLVYCLRMSCIAEVSPVRDIGNARLQLQGKIGNASLTKVRKQIAAKVSDLQNKLSGYVKIVEKTTQRLADEAGEVQRQYIEYKRQFDELKLALDDAKKQALEQESQQSEDELKKQAQEEQGKAEDENRKIEVAEAAEKDGKSRYDETLSEAAQKAVDAERERRKKEAEDKALAEGKDASSATWEDLTEEEIAKIADEADGLEDVSDDDRAEGEKLKGL